MSDHQLMMESVRREIDHRIRLFDLELTTRRHQRSTQRWLTALWVIPLVEWSALAGAALERALN